MDARIVDAIARLPDYFGSHVRVSLTALLLGLIISLPLAIASVRRPALRAALLTSTSVLAVPTPLALPETEVGLFAAFAGIAGGFHNGCVPIPRSMGSGTNRPICSPNTSRAMSKSLLMSTERV